MTEKTIIECDAADCSREYGHIVGDFLVCDITEKGWIYVPEHETHYCPRCKPEVIRELDSDGVEYIS